MAEKLYDENREEIYSGRGRYSRTCRKLMAEGRVYLMNEEGNLVPKSGGRINAPLIQQSTKKIQTEADEMARMLGFAVTEYGLQMKDDDGRVLTANLSKPSMSVLHGLSLGDIANLVNTLTGWFLQRGIQFYEYQELVDKLHRLFASNQLPQSVRRGIPATMSDVVAPSSNALQVNQIPGVKSDSCFEELWVVPGLMPTEHRCQPQSEDVEVIHPEDMPLHHRFREMEECRELWEAGAEAVAHHFVCDNLRAAAQSRCLQRGVNKTVRIFLNFENTNNGRFERERGVHDYGEYHDCLERFIATCRELKQSGVSPELQLFIYRGDGTVEEVVL